MKWVIAIIVIILVVAGGYYLFYVQNKPSADSNDNSQPTATNTNQTVYIRDTEIDPESGPRFAEISKSALLSADDGAPERLRRCWTAYRQSRARRANRGALRCHGCFLKYRSSSPSRTRAMRSSACWIRCWPRRCRPTR